LTNGIYYINLNALLTYIYTLLVYIKRAQAIV